MESLSKKILIGSFAVTMLAANFANSTTAQTSNTKPKTANTKTAVSKAAASKAKAEPTLITGAPSGLPDPGAIKRGEQVFKNQMCIGCHLNGDNNVLPDKPIKGVEFSAKYKDDAAIARVVRAGFGASGMPSYDKDRINDSDMKDLIAYVRSLSLKSK